VGLIITEGTVVDRPASSNDPNVPHFHGEQALAGWRRAIHKVHSAGGAMAQQIWHMGIVAPTSPAGSHPLPRKGLRCL
jgi:2,4-dienoyl-CoA reductase-like NADH-dependent reductase (Old Yellow Enzyme family)